MPKRVDNGVRKRCECSRRTWNTCPHPWYFAFHFKGRAYRFPLTKIVAARGAKPPRTRLEAAVWRDRFRNEIRAGTDPRAPVQAAHRTVGDVMDRYIREYVGKRVDERATPTVTWTGEHLRASTARQADNQLAIARACLVPAAGGGVMPFGEKPIALVRRPDIEAIRTSRRAHGVVGCNRVLARVKHFFGWAVVEGEVDAHPFKRHGVTVVKLELSAEAPRTRRLEPGEEAALLSVAGDHLRALIVAALSTGCRVGELLSLQWRQIRHDDQGTPRWIELPARKTKTGKARVLPIGPRLRGELTMRRLDPDGEPHGADAYVFGTETGERVRSIKRAWETAVLRAHGHTPTWVKKRRGCLTPESREALRTINLHFHDLRRQFACQLLESSADLHDVRDFLGHANITTTSRYLSTSPMRLERALARMEGEPERASDAASETGDAETGSADPGASICTGFSQTASDEDAPSIDPPGKSLH